MSFLDKRKKVFYCTALLQLFICIGAVPAAIGFIVKPDGSSLGMSVSLLKESPFEDFLIPGIVLLFLIGFGSIFGSFLSFKQHRFSGKLTIILGFVLIIWISAQVYWIGSVSWLQPVFFVIGVIEIFLGYKVAKTQVQDARQDDIK